MSSKISVSEIKDAFPSEKTDALWTRYVLRPISFPIAWLCLKIGLTANLVTYLSIVILWVGTGFFVTGSYPLAVSAAVLFNVFALLDCVDGNIARTSSSENLYGEWVDAFGGYIAYTLVFVSSGIYVNMTHGGVWQLESLDFVLIGAVAALANLMMRLQHQKFVNVSGGSDETESEDSIQQAVSRNIGITGALMPAVFFGTVFGVLDWVLLGYAGFYIVGWIAVSAGQIATVERSGPE